MPDPESHSPPRVTVVLPVYNGERTLERAIASIREQTFTDWELTIYDDGSTDGSLALCERLAADDERIRVIPGDTNRGLGAAMNRLVTAASADVIAVQEQDDWSVPDRLATQVAAFDADPGVGVVSGIARWTSDGVPVAEFPGLLANGGRYPDDMVSYLLVEQCKVVNACVMFHRRCLPTWGRAFDDDARMSVDWQFFIDVAHHERFTGINEVLVEVDRTPTRGSLTADKSLQAAEARRCLGIVRRRYLRDQRSPVSRSLLRQAWATEINLEGRWRGGLRGLPLILLAWSLDPRRPALQTSARSTVAQGVAKMVRVIRRPDEPRGSDEGE